MKKQTPSSSSWGQFLGREGILLLVHLVVVGCDLLVLLRGCLENPGAEATVVLVTPTDTSELRKTVVETLLQLLDHVTLGDYRRLVLIEIIGPSEDHDPGQDNLLSLLPIPPRVGEIGREVLLYPLGEDKNKIALMVRDHELRAEVNRVGVYISGKGVAHCEPFYWFLFFKVLSNAFYRGLQVA